MAGSAVLAIAVSIDASATASMTAAIARRPRADIGGSKAMLAGGGAALSLYDTCRLVVRGRRRDRPSAMPRRIGDCCRIHEMLQGKVLRGKDALLHQLRAELPSGG